MPILNLPNFKYLFKFSFRDISYLLDAVQPNGAGKKQSEKEETETESRDYEKLVSESIFPWF